MTRRYERVSSWILDRTAIVKSGHGFNRNKCGYNPAVKAGSAGEPPLGHSREGTAERAQRNHWGNGKALSWELVHVVSEIQTNPKIGLAHFAEPERASRPQIPFRQSSSKSTH